MMYKGSEYMHYIIIYLNYLCCSKKINHIICKYSILNSVVLGRLNNIQINLNAKFSYVQILNKLNTWI